jgi:hypothetical protein
MSQPNALERDIIGHFTDRLTQLLEDTADTCERVDIDGYAISVLLLSALMAETANGAISLQLTEELFVEMCRAAHRQMKQVKLARKAKVKH